MTIEIFEPHKREREREGEADINM